MSEALRLADALDELDRQFSRNGLCGDAAHELRRLHEVEGQRDDLLDSLIRIMRHIPRDFGGASLSDDIRLAKMAIAAATME